MYPISDLTTFCRKTTGDVPPKLVGASTTVVGNRMYLYGGRLVAERRMVTDIYMFNLETFNWERIPQGPEQDLPRARYFHSADTWNNHLIIFGGMALQPDSSNPEELCVLNDVRFFNLANRRWVSATAEAPNNHLIPKARYAHLSSITSNRLFIVGGQDLSNVWLDDVHVFDLRKLVWVHRRDYPRHCGTYRSVAVAASHTVRFPQEEIDAGDSIAKLGPSGSRFAKGQSTPTKYSTTPDSLIHMPYTATPTDEYPSEIYLFSNYNFTNVQRELEVFKPTPGAEFTISDRSLAMTGTSFPPGLRFPTGAILGTHFIVAGTYLTQSYQSFSIWALDFTTMTWSRIDPGSALSSGSWFRSCLWPEANKFLVFGNSHGNLAADYNRRLLSWDHVACIDLEAFGIYQHPRLYMSIENQELGLAALEESVMSDFDIICEDGRKIPCSRRLLEERWPWFKQQLSLFSQSTSRALEKITSSSHDFMLPEMPNISKEPRPDPRLTPRSLNLSESYPVSLAFLQYLYTQSLITPLQHAPAVLSQLLLLSSTYNLGHLQSLVKHAMHRALTYATSVGIYGVSTLCNCRSLQIRALRVVMAYSQKRPTGRSSRDKDNQGGRNDGNGGGGSDPARPRGMSDAAFIHREKQSSGGTGMRGYSSASDSTHESVVDVTSITDIAFSFPATPTGTTFKHHSPVLIKDRQKPQIRFGDTSPTLSTPSLSAQSSSEGLTGNYTGRNALAGSSPSSAWPSPPSSLNDLSLESINPTQSQSTPGTPISRSSSPSDFGDFELPKRQFSTSNQRLPPRIRIPQKLDLLHERTFSVISTNTDQELVAVADLMSPMISGFSGQGNSRESYVGVQLDEGLNREIDTYFREHRSRNKGKQPERRWPSATASSSPQSTSTDDESDQLCERAYLSPAATPYPAFHLPSPFTIAAYHDSTPSLTSSSSSFSSRTPSTRDFHSPPTTPAISDFGYNHLHIIEENDDNQPLDSGGSGPMTFAPPPIDEYPPVAPFRFDDESDSQLEHLEPLRKNSQSSSLIESARWHAGSSTPSLKLEPLRHTTKSPTQTITPSTMLADPNAAQPRGGSVFSRFRGPRSSKSFDKGKERDMDFLKTSPSLGILSSKQNSQQLSSSNVSVWSTPESTISSNSKDDKKRKKEEAKVKRDQLAAELKAKQLKRKEEQDSNSLNSKRSGGKPAMAWEEDGAMYKGIF